MNFTLAPLILLFSASLWAAGEVTVERVSSEVVDGACYVDARINFNLHEDLLEALDHGVELDARIIIRVREKRKWLWDRFYEEDVIKFKLDHLLLSNVYIVTDVRNSRRRQFDTLGNALKYMGTLDRYLLFDNKNIGAGANLVGSLKTVLNVKNLPEPLKPVASLFNKWQSDSKWHKWTIIE